MKEMILATFVALAVTAGIASAGFASLANAATTLFYATGHSDTHDEAANNLGECCIGGAARPLPSQANGLQLGQAAGRAAGE